MVFMRTALLAIQIILISSTTRTPLRILTYFDDSISSLPVQYQDLIKLSLLPAATSWVKENIRVDALPNGVLHIDRRCKKDRNIINGSERKCIYGCMSQQSCGTHQIPEEHLAECVQLFGAGTEGGEGVSEEFILYVSAGSCPEGLVNTAVAGKHCQSDLIETRRIRPTHGYMRFCEDQLATSIASYEELVHKTLQRLLNILAFDRTLLERFHDGTGVAHPSDAIITQKRDYDTAAGATRAKLDYIVLPTVLEEVKSHFSCTRAPGAQLESHLSGEEDSVIYLERLFFGNEIMSAGLSQRGVVSPITRAILMDSGWYDIAQDFTEPLLWGRGAGCAFVLKFCYEQLSAAQYEPDGVAPFCVEPERTQCTNDHKAIGRCNIGQASEAVESKYLNFPDSFDLSEFDPKYTSPSSSSPTVGGDEYADMCPYFEPELMCSIPTNQDKGLNHFGEEYSGMSRCFNYMGSWSSIVTGMSRTKLSGCYPIECGTGSYTVRVNKAQYTCRSGETIEVGNYEYGFWFNGTLVCPDYDVMCPTHTTCTKDCSGNGKCVGEGEEESCICYPGYRGNDCELTYGVEYCREAICNGASPCIQTDGGFTCDCPNGKTGVFCHLSSACTDSSCLNGGRCSEDENGQVVCSCLPGFAGDRCEEQLAECQVNECLNDASCFVDDSYEKGFVCACAYIYDGEYCESVKDCEIFGPLSCGKGGKCIMNPSEDGANYCQCDPGFVGSFCELEMCTETSCNGHGVCTEDFFAQTLTCQCDDFYRGERCEIESSPMEMPCFLLGRCQNIDGAIVCNERWTGVGCMDVDHCSTATCHPVNTARCINLDGGYECECLGGWTGVDCGISNDFSWTSKPSVSESYTTPAAELPSDPCDPSPCLNDAICISNNVNYFCQCTVEWRGRNCEVARGPCSKDPCKNGGQCTENGNRFACSCPDDYTGATCETWDPCAMHECLNGGQCTVDQDMARCDCPIGFAGDYCETKESHCFAEPCRNGAECIYHSDNHTFTCACPLGFIGETCDEILENSCELANNCSNDTPCIGSIDDYVCDCPDGLEGDRCEINPNDCIGNPCQAFLFSRCKDLIGGYDCPCIPGFEKNSGQCGDINECNENPCVNGICINLPGKYRCMCKAGWKGENCDIDFDECAENADKCKNGATCVDMVADYRCVCVDGYKGVYCETPPEPCDSDPCMQDAICHNVGTDDFQCSCPTGFVGKRCETNYDECQDEPCSEHGTCIDGINMATCQCDVGWGGSECNIYIGHCLQGKSPCMNGASCVDLPNNEYECQCTDYFTGEFCEENIDDCASSPCLNGATCTDGLGEFTCTCTAEWQGPTCAEDVDECAVEELTRPVCENNATCVNLDGGFECECRYGFEGELCNINTDDCQHHQCTNGGICVDDIAGYSCSCPDDYKGERCETLVQKCEPGSCLNNGICNVLDNVLTCNCQDTGFKGERCETEIDECQNITCLHGGECIDLVSGYSCSCPCSFTGPICEEEVDFCINSTCHADHTSFCLSLPNSCEFRCECLGGYEGTMCELEVDECTPEPCNHGNCTDLVNGYSCTCEEGWGGETCDTALDRCTNDPCLNGALCETVVDETTGERDFMCTCATRYYGRLCEEERPPCYVSPCGDNGLCQISAENAEYCICDEGYEGSLCEINIDDCVSSPCLNNGTCLDGVSDYTCSCPPGYGGKTCEALRDPCIREDLCENGGECAECLGDECTVRYTCTCADGFDGPRCTNNIDDCADDPCVNGFCIDGIADFECFCNLGYEGKVCDKDIDECATSPCGHDNECIDQIGSYLCNCVGYTGVNCETDIDECMESPCLNGGACTNLVGSFECECRDGFDGEVCENIVLPCDEEPCKNLGICTNLGALDFNCTCIGGYTGDTCSTPSDVCANYECNSGTCIENGGVASCVCGEGYLGDRCEVELCRPDLCLNNGTCSNTPDGYSCTCPLPYVGDKCQNKVNVLQFTPTSSVTLPLGEVTQTSVKLNMGLKVKDMSTEQQVLSQATNMGELALLVVDGAVRLTLGEDLLELDLPGEYAAVGVTLVEHYLELTVGNETEVLLFSEPEDVSPRSGLTFGGVTTSVKRAAVSSYTGCLVDLDNSIGILTAGIGEGFVECEEDEEDATEEVGALVMEACQNGGKRVGPFCQCPAGYQGDLCEQSLTENCQTLECPGECRQTSRGPECVCHWPAEGTLCGQLAVIPSFRADSSLTFSDPEFAKGSDQDYSLLIEINPEYPRGVIAVLTGTEGSCSLFLDDKIVFECSLDGEVEAREHPAKINLDHWTLIEITIAGEIMSIAVDNAVQLFKTPFPELILDGSVIFGSVPKGRVYLPSVPGFFGEINPLQMGNRKPDLADSVGVNMVSAVSRDTTKPQVSSCDSDPCGNNAECYDRAVGYHCSCKMNSGAECTEVPDLLTFYGTGHAVFNAEYGKFNELRLRFRTDHQDGILIYGASKYSDKTPDTLFYVGLSGQGISAVVYGSADDTAHRVDLPVDLSGDEWNDVVLILHPQKMELRLGEGAAVLVARTKFDRSMNFFLKNTFYVGGVKDSTGLDYLNNAFSADLSTKHFSGTISEVTVNGKSVMSSLIRLSGVRTGGKLPECAVNPCTDGYCRAGQCHCDNVFKEGDLCQDVVSFHPMKVAEEDGCLIYHKNFDVGSRMSIQFSRREGVAGEVFKVASLFEQSTSMLPAFNVSSTEAISLEILGNGTLSLAGIHGDMTPVSAGVVTLTIRRKARELELYNGDDLLLSYPISSSFKLEKTFRVGCGGSMDQVYGVKFNDEDLAPIWGKGVSEGTYPPCYNGPCLNGATCIETSDTDFVCNCTTGYTSRYCNEMVDMCSTSPCNATSRCTSVMGTDFVCHPCPIGYRGTGQCEEKAFCDLIQPCIFLNISGNCTETEESYTCDCGDGKDRKDCDLRKTCAAGRCLNNGTCIDLEDDFECICDEAFEGRYCETPVDNCVPDACQNNGTCISRYEGGYFCMCDVGYSGDRCEIEDDMCSGEPCQNNATCSTVSGTFMCSCSGVFSGPTCSRSPCDSNICAEGECRNINTTNYECECSAGYTGELCDTDIDECAAEDACSLRGLCDNSVGSYSCDCYPGFTGQDCEVNIDECDPDPCNGHGLCMDGFNGYTCLCDALYQGQNCSEMTDKCSPDPCRNNATCFNYGIDYFCICPPGYEGVNCTTNTDDCRNNRCENGAECVDEVNGYTCRCTNGYTGLFCETDVDECLYEPCANGGTCTNTLGSFTCSCPPYYDGILCEIALGECYGNPCQNGGSCRELGVVGEGRVCQCLEGWTGETCTDRITECLTNPCANDGECVVSETGYSCRCQYPFTGPVCQEFISVPSLISSSSTVVYRSADIDIEEGYQFRFRPTTPGRVLSVEFEDSDLTLAGDCSRTNFKLTVSYAGITRRVTVSISGMNQWYTAVIRAVHADSSIILEVNGARDKTTWPVASHLEDISDKMSSLTVGSTSAAASFVGCFYDSVGVLEDAYGAVEVTQCTAPGNTCNRFTEGEKCGEVGTCSEDMQCLCPVGVTGVFCDEDRSSVNPMFQGDGYLRLEHQDGSWSSSWTLQLAVTGEGDVFVGHNSKNKVVVAIRIDSTGVSLEGVAKETVLMKGYYGQWLDITISLFSDVVTVRIGPSGEEMMVLIRDDLDKVYLGGSPATRNSGFDGCFSGISLNDGMHMFTEIVRASECTMSACTNNPCGITSSDDNTRCIAEGPRYFSCECGPEYTGGRCETRWNNETPRFSGNSYIKFLNPSNYSSSHGELTLTVVFKVTERSGLLLTTEHTATSVDYLALGLSRGRVYLSYDLGTGPALLRCPRRVDDGAWHFAHVTLRGKHAVLMVDRWATEAVSPGERTVLNVGPHLFVGGAPPGHMPAMFQAGIQGCVESVAIWDAPLSMSDSVVSSNVEYCEDNVPETSIYYMRYRL